MPALLCEVRQCCCCSILTGVRILVGLCTLFGLLRLNGAVVQVVKQRELLDDHGNHAASYEKEIYELLAQHYKEFLFCSVISLLAAVIGLGIVIYAGYIVFSPADKLREKAKEMRMVRNLWLAGIAIDFLSGMPWLISVQLLLVRGAKHSKEEAGKEGPIVLALVTHLCLALIVSMLFFIFIDTLDARVQAGGNGTEELTSDQLVGDAASAPLTDGKGDVEADKVGTDKVEADKDEKVEADNVSNAAPAATA